jgi:hypothetical protein
MAGAEPRSIACTLFEGRHGLGVGALLNSLIAVGFSGLFVAGYRGALPVWTRTLPQRGTSKFEVSGIEVYFVSVDTDRHLTNYKPVFIRHVLEDVRLADSDVIAYFDPDIVVRGNWKFFEQWCGYGIALCEDLYSPMHVTHPKRQIWRELFPDLYGTARELDAYINGGFIALKAGDRDVLDLWEDIIVRGFDPSRWYTSHERDPRDPFSAFDQDALNIAISATAHPVSIVGPEQMDFRPGGYLMSHAVGPDKPWNGGFCRRVVLRKGLRLADRLFMKAISHPIRIFGPARELRLRVDFELARVINVVRGSSR